ncbi:MAG: cold-shock protein [Thermodesulfobacteriota bacterium]
MEDRENGTVKWFNDSEGIGFILRDRGGEASVHYRSICGTGYRTLLSGQRVEFDLALGDKGPRAENVIVLF